MSKKNVYLVAYYTIKPKSSRVKTQLRGWMEDSDNVSWDEQVGITTKLKKSDLSMAKVILDLSERKVFRNSWNNGKGFDDLFEHYYQGYQRYLDPVIKELGYEMVENPANVPTVTDVLPKNETISSQ